MREIFNFLNFGKKEEKKYRSFHNGPVSDCQVLTMYIV